MLNKNHFPDWFAKPGAYVLVDGQFGSTGKGLLAGAIAETFAEQISHVTANCGPNSGHTAYFNNRDMCGHGAYAADVDDFEEVMTQQIPVASVFLNKLGRNPITLLNGGAVIDGEILAKEVLKYGFGPRDILVHPCAAYINDLARLEDQLVMAKVAGTGKGTGPAIARKALRYEDAIARSVYMPMLPLGFPDDLHWDNFWDWSTNKVFVETAQGFSLGVNSSRFFPFTTSRECTVMQALSDARIPAQMLGKVAMTLRTYPIRVGDYAGQSSGPCYPDQKETSWAELGLEPELTSVTKRVRRVFTWSRIQFREAVAANRPDVLFLNFCNYLESWQVGELVEQIKEDYGHVTGKQPDAILAGFGPHTHDIRRMF